MMSLASLIQMWCEEEQACSIKVDLEALSLQMSTACSMSLMLRDLLVSPMYSFPQEQGTMYTHFCKLGLIGSLTESVSFLIVLWGMKATLILCLFFILFFFVRRISRKRCKLSLSISRILCVPRGY